MVRCTPANCGRGWRGARKARHEPGEGSFVSALRANPSPALAELVIGPATSGRTRWLGHPLPQGEREFGASPKPKLRSVLQEDTVGGYHAWRARRVQH